MTPHAVPLRTALTQMAKGRVNWPPLNYSRLLAGHANRQLRNGRAATRLGCAPAGVFPVVVLVGVDLFAFLILLMLDLLVFLRGESGRRYLCDRLPLRG